MLRIGEFAWLSQVTVETLRHYDRIGLLKPVHLDRFTGYRYYSLALPQLTRLVALHFQRTLVSRALQRLAGRGDDEASRAALDEHATSLGMQLVDPPHQLQFLDRERAATEPHRGRLWGIDHGDFVAETGSASAKT